MKVTNLFFLSILLSGQPIFAEAIKCQTQHSSSFSLSFSTSQPPTTPPSLQAQLKTDIFSGSKKISLKMAPRLDSLNYAGYWNPESFWLSLGTFHGEGNYPNSTLTLKGENNTKVIYNLKCQLRGPIEFKNACEETVNNSPQQNLFDSVRHINVDLLESTLPCQVNVNAVDRYGCSPLLILSDSHCGTGQYDPYAAYDIKAMVSDLIQAGASVDARDPVTKETALIKIAHLSDLDSVKILLAANANINAQDKEGMTALMRAVETRYIKLVQFIVDEKADLNLRNSSGMTAIEIAQAKGYSELYNMLSGPGVNTVTVQGDTSGVCSPMTLTLKRNQPNKVVLTTKNSMLMLSSPGLSLNLMAGSGMDSNATITPQKTGEFTMTCGPQMGSGNPQGKIIVQ